jgi:hypothetical protein
MDLFGWAFAILAIIYVAISEKRDKLLEQINQRRFDSIERRLRLLEGRPLDGTPLAKRITPDLKRAKRRAADLPAT